ncbi:hypothetical protein D920_02905 [Enterococcus faecalis 13-SD-W-01]|nr:hypothetical protein D920_02905 [Enterococcus faecalis 13-SD-W-01]
MKKMIAFTLASMTLGTALIGTAMGVQANEIGTNKSALNVVTDNFSRPTVTLFTGLNGTGRKLVTSEDELSLYPNMLWLDDNIASVRLPAQSQIRLFEHPERTVGGFRTVVNSNDSGDLLVNMPSDWLGRISGFAISTYEDSDFGVNLFELNDQGGRTIALDEPYSDYDLAASGNLDNRINSIEIYPNSGIIVFEEAGLLGNVFAVYENYGTEVMHIDLSTENPALSNSISSYSAYRLP